MPTSTSPTGTLLVGLDFVCLRLYVDFPSAPFFLMRPPSLNEGPNPRRDPKPAQYHRDGAADDAWPQRRHTGDDQDSNRYRTQHRPVLPTERPIAGERIAEHEPRPHHGSHRQTARSVTERSPLLFEPLRQRAARLDGRLRRPVPGTAHLATRPDP